MHCKEAHTPRCVREPLTKLIKEILIALIYNTLKILVNLLLQDEVYKTWFKNIVYLRIQDLGINEVKNKLVILEVNTKIT